MKSYRRVFDDPMAESELLNMVHQGCRKNQAIRSIALKYGLPLTRSKK